MEFTVSDGEVVSFRLLGEIASIMKAIDVVEGLSVAMDGKKRKKSKTTTGTFDGRQILLTYQTVNRKDEGTWKTMRTFRGKMTKTGQFVGTYVETLTSPQGTVKKTGTWRGKVVSPR